jgi:Predicted kinase
MKNKLTLVRGLPGSGKSTYAKNNFNCLVLENDMYHVSGGEYRWTGKRQGEAVRWCFDTCRNALKSGMDVVVCNTFTTRQEMEKYISLTEECGAELSVIRMGNDFGNVHNVPESTLKCMKSRFADFDGEILVTQDGVNNPNILKGKPWKASESS